MQRCCVRHRIPLRNQHRSRFTVKYNNLIGNFGLNFCLDGFPHLNALRKLLPPMNGANICVHACAMACGEISMLKLVSHIKSKSVIRRKSYTVGFYVRQLTFECSRWVVCCDMEAECGSSIRRISSIETSKSSNEYWICSAGAKLIHNAVTVTTMPNALGSIAFILLSVCIIDEKRGQPNT